MTKGIDKFRVSNALHLFRDLLAEKRSALKNHKYKCMSDEHIWIGQPLGTPYRVHMESKMRENYAERSALEQEIDELIELINDLSA